MTIKERDFDTILHDDDEFFLYLTTWDTTAEEKVSQSLRCTLTRQAQVEAALEGSPVPIYTSSDPRFYTNLSIANPAPTSVLLSFASHNPKFIGSVSLPAGQQKLEKFIFMNEQPTLMDLTSDAYDSVMKNDKHPLVVVGVIRPGTEGAADRAVMLSTARAWKRGGRAFQQPVWFVNVDAEEWAKWLKKMVSIKVEDAPVAVVIDTDTREYYDITLEGERAGLTGPDIFSLLEGVFQQYLKPKKIESGLEWGARSATLSLMSAGVSAFVLFPYSGADFTSAGVSSIPSRLQLSLLLACLSSSTSFRSVLPANVTTVEGT